MASLRNTVKDYQDELKDGIAWVAFWREGRSWNADYFYLEPDDAIQALDRSRMEEIREADPAAVMLNSYYCGHLGEDMNLDELAAGVRWHYENGYNQLSDFLETELMEQSIEKVLFYARLGSVEKDYLIKEISLKQCVLEVLSRNKQFLIHNRVCVHTDSISDFVYSDSKWLGFIINQIIFNSIKYCSDKPPVIQIKSKDMGDYVTLSITDNGIGIKPSEVNRVFDKGFVGSNGRMRKKSTGIGLYLCDQLCLKLGIGIDIESEVGCYTTVLLHFPKSNHLNV